VTWVKLDDQFFRNAKVLRAGRDARDLYLAGLCFCAGSLTDGHIPRNALRMLGAEADIGDPAAAADRLMLVGLWHATGDGFTVHDWRTYNPSAEQVRTTREHRAEAGRLGGVRSGESRRSHIDEANGKQNASGFASPVLEANAKQNRTPSPVRGTDLDKAAASTDPGAAAAALPQGWVAAWEACFRGVPAGRNLATLRELASGPSPPSLHALRWALQRAKGKDHPANYARSIIHDAPAEPAPESPNGRYAPEPQLSAAYLAEYERDAAPRAGGRPGVGRGPPR
jgi:hypothetical protein